MSEFVREKKLRRCEEFNFRRSGALSELGESGKKRKEGRSVIGVKGYVAGRVVQFGVRSKVWVHELSRILTNPKKSV